MSDTFEIGPAAGSPCYAVSIDYGNFTNWSLTGAMNWNPTIYNLPKDTNDYDIKLEVTSNVGVGGTTDVFTPDKVDDTTVQFKDQAGNDVTWNDALAPYRLDLTIHFKNKLKNVTDISKTITIN